MRPTFARVLGASLGAISTSGVVGDAAARTTPMRQVLRNVISLVDRAPDPPCTAQQILFNPFKLPSRSIPVAQEEEGRTGKTICIIYLPVY